MKKPTCRLEVITPADAKKLLSKHKGNRKMRAPNLAMLINEIKTDKFEITGETIKLDWDGNLMDAQHRLEACIAANKPIETFVVRDLDPKVMAIIDTGKSRSAADLLHMSGIDDAATIASMVKFVIAFNRGAFGAAISVSSTAQITNAAIGEYTLKHLKSLSLSAEFASIKLSTKIVGPALISSLHYIFKGKSEEDADDFCQRLLDGTQLKKTSPIYVLREKLLNDSRSKHKMTRPLRVATICKAWNLYREDKTVSIISYDANKEGFPKPI